MVKPFVVYALSVDLSFPAREFFCRRTDLKLQEMLPGLEPEKPRKGCFQEEPSVEDVGQGPWRFDESSLRDAGPNQVAGLPGPVATKPAEANGGAHRHYHRARRTYEAECMSQRTSPGGCGQIKRATAWTADRRHSGRSASPSLALLTSKADKEFILRVKGEFLEIKRKWQRILSQFPERKTRAANKHVKTLWASPPSEAKSGPRRDCPLPGRSQEGGTECGSIAGTAVAEPWRSPRRWGWTLVLQAPPEFLCGVT